MTKLNFFKSAFIICLIFFLCQTGCVYAQDYFVSTTGSDSNNGKSQTSPFRTIQKCAQIVQPGDNCLIRGGTYRETIKPVVSGSQSVPITFTSFNGEKVMISGTEVISNWTLYSGSIYTTQVDLNPNLFANQVFLNKVMLNEARWPNTGSDLLNSNFATAQTGSTKSLIKDTNLNQAVDFWKGATVYIVGGCAWVAQTGTVTKSSSGQIEFQGGDFNPDVLGANKGTKYYLTGIFNALDSLNEWFYDKNTKKLYYWSNGSPNSQNIEVKNRDLAFDLSDRSYIQIKNLEMFASTILMNQNSQANLLDNIDANYVSHFVTIPNLPATIPYWAHQVDTGLLINGSNNIVKNSRIANSAGNGISVQGNGHLISNNIIHDVNYAAVYNAPIYVRLGSSGIKIKNNLIYNSGRDGIMIAATNAGSGKVDPTEFLNSEISNNDIYNTAKINLDSGGIYICCSVNGQGTVIHHNWVHDLQAKDLRGHTCSVSYTGSGIYLDNGSGYFSVHHNVLWNNTGAGIHLNGGGDKYTTHSNNLIYNNTIGSGHNNSIAWQFATNLNGTRVINNIFRNNFSTLTGVYQANNLSSSVNPLFISESKHDYQLQSNSPAINKGQIIGGITDGFNGNSPDIGAYEYGNIAWTAGLSDLPVENNADLNKDGVVNLADLAILLVKWGNCNDCSEDLNSDNIINLADLQVILSNWGR